MSPAPKFTGSALQGIEDRLRRLYGLAGDLGVTFEPNVTLSVDAGDLLGPGSNLYRGRRWWYQSVTDTALASTVSGLSFSAPTIIEQIWVSALSANLMPFSIGLVDPSGGPIPTPFRTVFWSELYSDNTVNQNPPMTNSGFQAGTAAGVRIMDGAVNGDTFVWDCEFYVPGQLPPPVVLGNLHQLQVSVNVSHAGGFAWGCRGRMF